MNQGLATGTDVQKKLQKEHVSTKAFAKVEF